MAYHKQAWQTVGGYPEWLDYGEDLIFDLALRREYGPMPFAPGAVVYFRPQGESESFRTPILFLCSRRRKGQPLAQKARDSLSHLPARIAA